jgi:hypothetical protein
LLNMLMFVSPVVVRCSSRVAPVNPERGAVGGMPFQRV